MLTKTQLRKTPGSRTWTPVGVKEGQPGMWAGANLDAFHGTFASR